MSSSLLEPCPHGSKSSLQVPSTPRLLPATPLTLPCLGCQRPALSRALPTMARRPRRRENMLQLLLLLLLLMILLLPWTLILCLSLLVPPSYGHMIDPCPQGWEVRLERGPGSRAASAAVLASCSPAGSYNASCIDITSYWQYTYQMHHLGPELRCCWSREAILSLTLADC